ncbi:MAG TPA: tRNA pseudouridine(38-40) synthase TruA [Burkholderiaceae bacterium]
MRIALAIEYDGRALAGWQSQPHGNTVQDKLEAALSAIAGQPVGTIAAGRTDAGVHALEQVVHFDTALERDMFSWVRGVNSYLPPSIVVRWAAETAAGPDGPFHSRFSARSRTYHYVLYNNAVRSPLLRGRAGWVFRPLDVERMREAAQSLLGTHDFSAFRAAECQAKSPIKEMQQVRIVRRGDVIVFTFRASAFLHHMVRNLVGSLIFIGSGKREVGWLKEVLEGRDRSVAAPTFAPDGLYLAQVGYDAFWSLPQEQPMLPW